MESRSFVPESPAANRQFSTSLEMKFQSLGSEVLRACLGDMLLIAVKDDIQLGVSNKSKWVE